MPINHPTRNELDATLKRVLVDPRNALDNVTELRDFFYSLDANGDTDAVKAVLVSEYNYTTDEAATVMNALNGLNQLRLVATGAAQQVGNNDFFFYAKKIWGINLARR